jgi:uncharacterized integral membrane protein
MREKVIGVRDRSDWNVSFIFILLILLILIKNLQNIEKKYAALDAHCLAKIYGIIEPKIKTLV